MSVRAEELAEQFERINGEVIAFVEDCDDHRWQLRSPAEQWTVGVVAGHIADGHDVIGKMVQDIVAGNPVTLSTDELHAGNARRAVESEQRGRAAVLIALRRNGEDAAAIVRMLDDDDLRCSASFPLLEGATWSTEQVIQRILIRHPQSHLKSMREATTPVE